MAQDQLPTLAGAGAILDAERRYRYVLERVWSYGDNWLCVVGLNPSTADERLDDPTVRRCRGYAQAWGYDGLRMVNLFALRATDPGQLRGTSDPVGPDNDAYIAEACARAGYGNVLAAWGNGGAYRGRGREVTERLLARWEPRCLGVTKHGHPLHPLYVRADAVRVPYLPPGSDRWPPLPPAFSGSWDGVARTPPGPH